MKGHHSRNKNQKHHSSRQKKHLKNKPSFGSKIHAHQIETYFKENLYLNTEKTIDLSQVIQEMYLDTDMEIPNDKAVSFTNNVTPQKIEENSSYTQLINIILAQARQIQELQTLPPQIAEAIAKFIELLDLTKMPSIATRTYVESLLNELAIILKSFDLPILGNILLEIEEWEKKIQPKFKDKIFSRKSIVISSELCEQLGLRVNGWIEEFKLKLVDIARTL